MNRIRAWTDYPIAALGDIQGQRAPIRAVEVLAYDGGLYCHGYVGSVVAEIKAGYLYSQRGRLGEVPPVLRKRLALLPRRIP